MSDKVPTFGDGSVEPALAGSIPIEAASVARRTPRVWTVFVTVLVSFLLAIMAQLIIAMIVLASSMASGMDARQAAQVLVEQLMTPPAFLALLVLSQALMGVTTLLAAWRSPVPLKQRLNLLAPHGPRWTLAVFPLGSLFPLAVSVGAAYGMTYFFKPDESMELFYRDLTTAWAIPFIVLIGVLPGLTEELLFRGYAQTRLVERYGPFVGISITTLMFAAFHVTPHAFALALIMGTWLGFIAWRTGSIWPSAFCHAFVNSSWNVWQSGQRLWGLPAAGDFSTMEWVIMGVVAMFLFAYSIRLLRSFPHVADTSDPMVTQSKIVS